MNSIYYPIDPSKYSTPPFLDPATAPVYDPAGDRRDPINSDPVKAALDDLFKSNTNCAAALGGLKNAENLLNKMITYDVPYTPYVKGVRPVSDDAWDKVAASNAGTTPRYKDAAVTVYTAAPDGNTWNGSSYVTFVGDKFARLDQSQQETVLIHEMAHPYWGGSGTAEVDNPYGMYSVYNQGVDSLGGIPFLCGTEALPLQ